MGGGRLRTHPSTPPPLLGAFSILPCHDGVMAWRCTQEVLRARVYACGLHAHAAPPQLAMLAMQHVVACMQRPVRLRPALAHGVWHGTARHGVAWREVGGVMGGAAQPRAAPHHVKLAGKPCVIHTVRKWTK